MAISRQRNVLIDSNFCAKVSDSRLSAKKHVVAYWMAPELLRGESTEIAVSDICAFGVLLYEGEAHSVVLPLVCGSTVKK